MTDTKKYTGGCHCGNVRYEVDLSLDKLITCNCSICSKKGYILAFVPGTSFKLLQGESALTDYQFNTKNVHHLFCSTCGIQSFSRGTGKDGTPMCSINVRCLDGVDPHTLTPKQIDGRNR